MDEEEAAVLIAPPDVDAPLRPLVINLRDARGGRRASIACWKWCRPIESARDPLRERWKQYQARGLELNKYDM